MRCQILTMVLLLLVSTGNAEDSTPEEKTQQLQKLQITLEMSVLEEQAYRKSNHLDVIVGSYNDLLALDAVDQFLIDHVRKSATEATGPCRWLLGGIAFARLGSLILEGRIIGAALSKAEKVLLEYRRREELLQDLQREFERVQNEHRRDPIAEKAADFP